MYCPLTTCGAYDGWRSNERAGLKFKCSRAGTQYKRRCQKRAYAERSGASQFKLFFASAAAAFQTHESGKGNPKDPRGAGPGRHQYDGLFGKVRGVSALQGDGHDHVDSSPCDGCSCNGRLFSDKGVPGATDSVIGAERPGQQLGCCLCFVVDGGAAAAAVCREDATTVSHRETICPAGPSKLGRGCLELHQGAGGVDNPQGRIEEAGIQPTSTVQAKCDSRGGGRHCQSKKEAKISQKTKSWG